MQSAKTVPEEYLNRPEKELVEAIKAIKKKHGDALVILGHHYQRESIVRLSDFIGDSFKLCQDASQADAKYIVFCGVRFMAESARVVARPDQIVQHPEPSAGCPMADMADFGQVERAWEILTKIQPDRKVIPVTYMNSSVEIKAFCGRNDGIVCTSSNASQAFDWAWKQGDTIFFLPDEHLGTNTALARGMLRDEILVWDPAWADEQAADERYTMADLIVWRGFCHVHTHFSLDHIQAARAEHPHAHIIVHPECPHEVVAAADSNGSTAAIVKQVREAKPGETVIIGTEINLVERLAKDYPEVNVLPLSRSNCPNMSKITLGHLLWTLENLGEIGVVELDQEVIADAKLSLGRMLELPK